MARMDWDDSLYRMLAEKDERIAALEPYEAAVDRMREHHGWKRDGREIDVCVRERIEMLIAKVAQARAEEREAIAGILQGLALSAQNVACVAIGMQAVRMDASAQALHNAIREIQRRGQEGSDG